MIILAIDLGQSKSVSCEFDTVNGDYRFKTFDTTGPVVRKVLEKTQADQVVIEICPLAAMVYDIGRELGISVLVADVTQDAWRWRNVKRKTDRDDALKLARLASIGQINPVHIPEMSMRQWRAMLEQRQALVEMQVGCKNRIRQMLRVNADARLPRGKNAWSLEARRTIHLQSRPLDDCGPEELWRGMLRLELEVLDHVQQQRCKLESRLDRMGLADHRVRLLKTLPGVAARVAETIVTSLDDAKRFPSHRQVGAYAGLTPRRFQSGQMDRSGHISKRGRPLLRKMLAQAAWAAVRHSEHFREIFQLVSHGSRGRRKIAIVAVMRRLLVIAWAMLRDETPYRPACRQKAA